VNAEPGGAVAPLPAPPSSPLPAPPSSPPPDWTGDEMMTVAAARQLADGEVCFVGIGLPSTVANLARRTHAPRLVLIYESGTIGTKPRTIPLSIGDGELAETADSVVSVPEIFNYWLQPGRIDVGFLGAAELDRHGDINTTVIGPYDAPKVRLPGAGGAPEIATSCGRVLVVMRHSRRAFVEKVAFRTSRGERVTTVITDVGVLERDADLGELVLTALHPGRSVADARAATAWDLQVADELAESIPPCAEELAVVRHLEATKGKAA
jgi:glutaconate CoA-transferase subunit B